MILDPARPDLCLGVVGAGTMGRGIVQIAAMAGIEVVLDDAREGAVADAIGFVVAVLDRAVEKGRLDASHAAAAKARVRAAGVEPGSFSRCHVVVEAISEDLEAKRRLFAVLEPDVAADCILATNTSSLSVTAIAAACRSPGRVAGFHFFNPVPLMRVVEVVGGLRTEDWVVQALSALARRLGHQPICAADTPGFLINHAGRGYGTEALRIVGEGIAGFVDVDRVLRDAAGFRMGPFELMDLTGLDISHAVMEGVYEQFYHEPRFRPSVIARQRVDAGLFGRKSGRGFYAYPEAAAAAPHVQAPSPEPLPPAWISAADPEARSTLADTLRRSGVDVVDGYRPPAGAICYVTPLGADATTTALAEGLDPASTVAVDTLFGLDRRRTLMATPVTAADARDAARAQLGQDGTPVTVIRDSPGFITQRVAAMIVNIASDICQQRIAAPADVDLAVTLGLGYPKGPLALGDHLGPARVLAVLEAMHDFYGDPRYRPSPWLKRRARLGVSLATPED